MMNLMFKWKKPCDTSSILISSLYKLFRLECIHLTVKEWRKLVYYCIKLISKKNIAVSGPTFQHLISLAFC